ncbi:hypothetical protein [Porcipelethomonas sp.]|uniref:hypothetical protein n=1 Tax=Porcipelethomonas sp. TaxID=2981675 RepID=UPI003EF72A78
MKSSDYTLIKTCISNDGQKIYFISSEMETIDGITAESLSISSAVPDEVVTVKNVATDLNIALKIFDNLKSESISPQNLKPYILNFLSEN